MPLSTPQFGKQTGPMAKMASAPSMNSRMPTPTPIPNARIPKPGATMTPPPLPNFRPNAGMGKITKL